MIRERTFKERTIQHTFRDLGIWPVSFKVVKVKIDKYRKKQMPKQILTDKGQGPPDYELPDLLPPSSYAECQAAIQSIQPKVQSLLSSPSRTRYLNIIQATYSYLACGSLHKIEIIQARATATNHLKNKEYLRKSLSKGKFLTGIEALERLISKRRKEANETLKRVKQAIQVIKNKRKGELKARGIQARKDEKVRIARLRGITLQELIIVEVQVPPELLHPIRDPEKQPLPNKLEALTMHPDLDQALL